MPSEPEQKHNKVSARNMSKLEFAFPRLCGCVSFFAEKRRVLIPFVVVTRFILFANQSYHFLNVVRLWLGLAVKKTI